MADPPVQGGAWVSEKDPCLCCDVLLAETWVDGVKAATRRYQLEELSDLTPDLDAFQASWGQQVILQIVCGHCRRAYLVATR